MNLHGLTLEEMYARINADAYLPNGPDPTGGRVMAQKVKLAKGKEFVFDAKPSGQPSKYPWDEWFNGDLLLLERSEGTENDKEVIENPTVKKDFEVSVQSMVGKLKSAARRKYKVVQINRRDQHGARLKDGLIIQARDMTQDERDAEDLLRAEERAARKEKEDGAAANGQAGTTTPAPAAGATA